MIDSNEEIWKDVKGYEGRYMVSNKGNVLSLKYHNSNTEKQLVKNRNNTGYLNVSLCKDGVIDFIGVHRLVALHFIPNDNPEVKTQVNHIDTNRENNCVENLEWISPSDNLKQSSRVFKVNTTRKKAPELVEYTVKKKKRGNPKPVLQYTLDGEFIREWKSATEAAYSYRVTPNCITQCCQGKIKTAYHFKWSYKEKDSE